MEVSKNKNIMTFDCEDGKKPYKLDINTATMFGRNGRALTHVPDEVRKYLTKRYKDNSYTDSWIIRVLVYKNFRPETIDSLLGKTTLLRLADKLDSLKYVDNHPTSDDMWDFLIENEKDFIKTIVKNPDMSINDFYNEYSLTLLTQKFGIKKETFSSTEWAYIKRNKQYAAYDILYKYFDYFCYYVKQGLAEISEYCNVTHGVLTYFQMCEELGISPEKTIFTKTFAAVARLYKEQQEQIRKKQLLAYKEEMKDKLFFENDTFTIVIPSCPMDFHKEAEAQDNCVERLYMERVAKRNTNVVFVRKKENPNDSFITCEVGNNGQIIQFLLSHNRQVKKEDALQFRYDYQKFLKTSMRR